MLERWADIFHVLGNHDRLLVLSLFLHHNDCLCACEAVDALDLPQYQVAKHLHALKKANLLDSNRYGRWAYYCLQKTEDTRPLVEFLRTVVPRKVCEVELTRLQERLTMRKNGRCVIGPANQNGSDE